MDILHSFSYKLLLLSLALMMIITPVSGLAMAPLFLLASLGPIILFIISKKILTLCHKVETRWIMIVGVLTILSGLWAIDAMQTWQYAGRLCVLLLAAIALYDYMMQLSQEQIKQCKKLVIYSAIIGTVLWLSEIITDGLLTRTLRLISGDADYKFTKDELNRGTTFLVLLFWSVGASLIKESKKMLITVMGGAILALWVFTCTDSLAAIIAMVISIGVCVGAYMLPRNHAKIYAIGSFIGIGILFVWTASLDSGALLDKVEMLPKSAKHRLVIWDFVAEKAMEKPIEGWGYHNARLISVSPEHWVGGFNPLPMHPHNMALQIWLELGLIGVVCLVGIIWTLLHYIDRYTLSPLSRAMKYAWYSAFIIIALVAYEAWQAWWLCTIAITFMVGEVFSQNGRTLINR